MGRRRRPDERPPEFIDGFSLEDFAAFVERVEWTYAKTMPYHPHFYTLRKKARRLGLEAEFESAARFIRENGYQQRFGNAEYIYFDLEDDQGTTWQYWTMGAPYQRTILINRAEKA